MQSAGIRPGKIGFFPADIVSKLRKWPDAVIPLDLGVNEGRKGDAAVYLLGNSCTDFPYKKHKTLRRLDDLKTLTSVLLLALACCFSLPNAFAGCKMGDCMNGEGIMTYPGGMKYIGQFKNGLSEGKGELIYPDESRYEGEFRKGRPNGMGKATYPSGMMYSAHFKDGFPHGEGTAIYPNGNEYAGEFRKGKRHGNGVMTYYDGKIFEGRFNNGVAGKGVLTDLKGEKTKGSWASGGMFIPSDPISITPSGSGHSHTDENKKEKAHTHEDKKSSDK